MATTIKQKVQMQLEMNGIGAANTQLNRLAKNSDKASGGVSGLSGAMALGSIQAMGIQKAVQLASQALRAFKDYLVESALLAVDAGESYNKFKVVFGEFADSTNSRLTELARNTNNSIYGLRDLAGGLQDLLVPMLDDREAATALSLATAELALDVASFQNKDVADVVNAMTSAYMGQTRSIKMLGVEMTESAVNAELLAMGLDETQQSASQAELMQARYNIMVRDSSDAIGDAARTSEEAQGALRGLQVAWDDGSVSVGEKFIPTIEKLAPLLEEGITEFIPHIEEFAEKLAELAEEFGPDVIKQLIAYVNLMVQGGTTILEVGGAVTEAYIAFDEFAESLNIAGGAMTILLGPLGIAIDGLLRLPGVLADVDKAVDQLEEAEARLSAQTNANILTQALYTQAMDEGGAVLDSLIVELQRAESEGAYLGDTLDTLRIRQTELNRVEDAAIGVTQDYTRKTDGLTRALLQVEIQTVNTAIATLKYKGYLEDGPSVIRAQIAELEAYAESLKRLGGEASSLSNSLSGAGGTSEPTLFPENRPEVESPFGGLGSSQDAAEQGTAQGLARANADLTAYMNTYTEGMIAYSEELTALDVELWEQRRNAAVEFSGLIANTFMEDWDNGFNDVGESFNKLLEQMLEDLVKSGLLTLVANLVAPGSGFIGAGTMGTFGNLLGGGGK